MAKERGGTVRVNSPTKIKIDRMMEINKLPSRGAVIDLLFGEIDKNKAEGKKTIKIFKEIRF